MIGNSWEMGLSQAILAAYKADRSAFIQVRTILAVYKAYMTAFKEVNNSR